MLDGETIRYRSPTYGEWEIPLSALRVLGAYTNEDGPGLDDWFLFFGSDDGEARVASAYGRGRDGFLADLSARLGTPLSLDLVFSTTFASRVLWPPSLAGQPLFENTRVPAPTLWQRALGVEYVTQAYTPPVAALMTGRRE